MPILHDCDENALMFLADVDVIKFVTYVVIALVSLTVKLCTFSMLPNRNTTVSTSATDLPSRILSSNDKNTPHSFALIGILSFNPLRFQRSMIGRNHVVA